MLDHYVRHRVDQVPRRRSIPFTVIMRFATCPSRADNERCDRAFVVRARNRPERAAMPSAFCRRQGYHETVPSKRANGALPEVYGHTRSARFTRKRLYLEPLRVSAVPTRSSSTQAGQCFVPYLPWPVSNEGGATDLPSTFVDRSLHTRRCCRPQTSPSSSCTRTIRRSCRCRSQ